MTDDLFGEDSSSSSNDTPSSLETDRDEWIEETCNSFVATSDANKHYYKALLELFWPKGSELPGPWRTKEKIRQAINDYRSKHRIGRDPDKPYHDPFRRLRELQGEEGIVGIEKKGERWRLASLETEEKRSPRTGIDNQMWERVKKRYSNQCANCGRAEPEVRLEPDHKVPRMRGGGDEEENWQPFCTECNNWKSTQCRNCHLNCQKCPWAFPRKFSRLRLDPELSAEIVRRAQESEEDPETVLNQIVHDSLFS